MDERLPQLLVDIDTPADISALFSNPVDRLHLEIGFGGGEHLAHQAIQNPTTGYIGVEPFINGMAKMLGAIQDSTLTNVRLYDDDATQLLDWLPDNCLDQIDLLYPDPWPKRRHWKRRFVSTKNLTRFSRVLKPDRIFRFASDIDTYVNWTLQKVAAQGDFQWAAQASRDWNEPWKGWFRTRYENKAIREGRTPNYLEFRNCG